MTAPDHESWEKTDVVICGGGPTGVLLSAFLARMKVSNIVLEKEPNITTDPRGIALDEDGIRLLQAIGIYDKIFTEIGSCSGRLNFISGKQHDLMKKPVLCIDLSTSEGGTGHVGVVFHKQPTLEKAIRHVIDQSEYSQLRSSARVSSISEDTSTVFVTYIDCEGVERGIKSRFLVGADGKTGFVRKKYLEPRGIVLEYCEGAAYDETWVALNWHISLPTPKTHPNFPLWSLGYTPEQVYDLFFPKEFRFLCNPERPAVCGRFGLEADRLWRFEFVVGENEDPQKMSELEETKKIIFPYLTHPGSRYNLPGSVQYPEDCIKTLRSRPFIFSAKSCNKWALGRTILVGDAAHVFPPFGGQGIASGFRDASSLAWRLAILSRGETYNYEELLKAWYSERKQQLEKSLATTVHNGRLVTERSVLKAFIRDWILWAVQLVPSWRRELEKGPRAEGFTRYRYESGFAFVPGGGSLLPQVYAVNLQDTSVLFSDDMIFAPWKIGTFQLVILVDAIEEAADALNELGDVVELSGGLILEDEATVIVQDTMQEMKTSLRHKCLIRLATSDEFAADPLLCKNRPAPRYYDPFKMRKELGSRRFVIVRPDRFLYANCSGQDELGNALKALAEALHQKRPSR